MHSFSVRPATASRYHPSVRVETRSSPWLISSSMCRACSACRVSEAGSSTSWIWYCRCWSRMRSSALVTPVRVAVPASTSTVEHTSTGNGSASVADSHGPRGSGTTSSGIRPSVTTATYEVSGSWSGRRSIICTHRPSGVGRTTTPSVNACRSVVSHSADSPGGDISPPGAGRPSPTERCSSHSIRRGSAGWPPMPGEPTASPISSTSRSRWASSRLPALPVRLSSSAVIRDRGAISTPR